MLKSEQKVLGQSFRHSKSLILMVPFLFMGVEMITGSVLLLGTDSTGTISQCDCNMYHKQIMLLVFGI